MHNRFSCDERCPMEITKNIYIYLLTKYQGKKSEEKERKKKKKKNAWPKRRKISFLIEKK